MKKRIISAALAAVLALNLCSLRPKAVGSAVAIGTAVGCAAVFIMGVITGQYDDTASGIGAVLENGWEGFEKAFIGTEKTFCGQVIETKEAWIVSGYKQICAKLTSWLESGDITLNDDGKVVMTYSQYLELYDLVGQAGATTDVVFNTDIPYYFFRAEQNIYYKVDRSISPVSFVFRDDLCSFSPVFYSKDTVYFSSVNLHYSLSPWSSTDNSAYMHIRLGVVSSSNPNYYGCYDFNAILDSGCSSRFTVDDLLDNRSAAITFMYAGNTFTANYDYFNISRSAAVDWYAFDGQTITAVGSSLDTSKLSFGYISSKGEMDAFVHSLVDFSATVGVPDLDDLSDPLATILTKTKDPTLEIDTDPSIATPADAVTVTDIPGEADVTLSQLRENTNVDIDIPSIIAEKFPFCVPFDFIRIISVLCADPVAPVFRIPISTNPDNLKGFEGNQTIGELPEDFEPMFEIDEELVIDLSAVPLVQPICYTVFIISFVVLLIFSTNKLINH